MKGKKKFACGYKAVSESQASTQLQIPTTQHNMC